MGYLALISIGILFGRYYNYLFGTKEHVSSDSAHAKMEKHQHVKYYSQGLELSKPYHIEYKMIASSMAGEWKYSKKFQEQIHDYPDESILDVKFNAPINRSYSYTIRHAELAYAYLRDQQVYLEHLN